MNTAGIALCVMKLLNNFTLILSQFALLTTAQFATFILQKLLDMETTTNSTRTIGLLTLFDYHTGFFSKALAGLSEADMHNRLNTQANHAAWLAGALVQQRFMMAKETGSGMIQTGAELFEGFKGIQADARYPSNEAYISDWDKITPEARHALVSIDDAKLDSMLDMGAMKMSYYEMISFTIYREASMIGQLALWRRLLGHPGLKYD